LLLQRYLTKDATGEHGDPEERRALLDAAIHAARSDPLRAIYGQAFTRWDDSFKDDLLHVTDLCTGGRLIIGLGNENVLETGIRLHHTYGIPVIPGSALKGLASHYCDHSWGQRGEKEPPDENQQFRRDGKYHDLLFGTTDDGGVIAFHDAWILPESLNDGGLMLDVMTPHHPKWQTNEAPPTDFDSPIPVAFLSVSGMFRVRVSWAGPFECQEAEKWTDLAFCLLKEALAEWGVGGKTSSGYGRLVDRKDEAIDTGNVATAVVAQASTTAVRPRHQRGDQVTAKRVEDSTKGKTPKKRFLADDGIIGYMDAGDGPNIDLGATVQMWIANAGPQGYTFSITQPKVKNKQPPSQQKKGRR
jgi:CRISPR type III-B/RAMP module RAMP protein Cmr6